jgi:hypothetical protein
MFLQANDVHSYSSGVNQLADDVVELSDESLRSIPDNDWNQATHSVVKRGRHHEREV